MTAVKRTTQLSGPSFLRSTLTISGGLVLPSILIYTISNIPYKQKVLNVIFELSQAQIE